MPSKAAWKTGEQLEFLISNWVTFVRHQGAKKLDHFWPRLFEDWHKRWPPHSTPALNKKYETEEAARLMVQKAKNAQIKNWFNNRGRGADAARGTRGDLKLDRQGGRKLAPVQAYCSYEWETSLRAIVFEQWEKQKYSESFEDDEDPPEDATSLEDCIPLSFKLKIAKELYDRLPSEMKKEIDRRREEDKQKLSRRIPEIKDEKERLAKLRIHQRNQPLVSKALLRVLSNLEDQAGCVAQLFVASVDPAGGPPVIQKFCQGETSGKLDFEKFYGLDWNKNVEQKFREWSLRIFGAKETERRNMFLLERDPNTKSEAFYASEPPIMPEALFSTDNSLSLGSSSWELSLQPPMIPAHPSSLAPASIPQVPATFESLIQLTPEPDLLMPPTPAVPPPVVNMMETIVPSTYESPGFIQPPNLVAYPSQLITATSQTLVEPPRDVVEPPSQPQPFAPPFSPAVVEFASHVTPQPSPQAAAQPSSQIVAQPPSQAATQPSSQVVALPPSQVANLDPRPAPNRSEAPAEMNAPSQPPVTPPLLTNIKSTSGPVPKTQYRVRGPAVLPSGQHSRRSSIDGAPEMVVDVIDQDGGISVDLREFINLDSDDGLSHVSSSQKTLDGVQELLSLPSDPEPSAAATDEDASQSQVTLARALPQLKADEGDLPAWMIKKGQWRYVASTAGGAAWESLLNIYMIQERRLEFTEMGASLTNEDRPSKIKEYFQYAHQPTRGDNLTLPDFGVEVSNWWKKIQPEWRRANHDPPRTSDQWSYILAGGSKGAFLLILCLAWWCRAYELHLKSQKETRRVEAEAAGINPRFDDLPDHDADWLKIVEDATFVMRMAQVSEVPTKGMPSSSRRVKRKRETVPPAPRKSTRTKA